MRLVTPQKYRYNGMMFWIWESLHTDLLSSWTAWWMEVRDRARACELDRIEASFSLLSHRRLCVMTVNVCRLVPPKE